MDAMLACPLCDGCFTRPGSLVLHGLTAHQDGLQDRDKDAVIKVAQDFALRKAAGELRAERVLAEHVVEVKLPKKEMKVLATAAAFCERRRLRKNTSRSGELAQLGGAVTM